MLVVQQLVMNGFEDCLHTFLIYYRSISDDADFLLSRFGVKQISDEM